MVQVRELSGGDSLREDRDTLGTRIERAVHIGASRPSMYATRCLDSFGIALSAAPDLVAWTEGY